MANLKPFKNALGVEILYYPGIFLGLLFVGYHFIYFLMGRNLLLVCAITIPFIPLFLLYIKKSLTNPEVILWTLVIFCLTANFAFRVIEYYFHLYITFGVIREVLLLILFLVVLFTGKSIDWVLLKNGFIYVVALWAAYILFEIFNPYQTGIIQWIYGCRNHLYFLFVPIFVFILINQRHHFDFLLKIIIFIGLIAGIYGFIQWYMFYYMGGLNRIDAWFVESKDKMSKTHILWGYLLRTFGSYGDAGSAGSINAFTSVLAFIFFIHTKGGWSARLYYLVVFIVCFINFGISGTRGAIIVYSPMAIYVLLSKNIYVRLFIVFLGLMFVYTLMLTNIGQGFYVISRMRSAFNPNDKSMGVRTETRDANAARINNSLIGFGLASTGYLGTRFLGNYNFIPATDGQFLVLRAELGVIGTALFILINLFIFVMTFWMLYKVKIPDKLYYQVLAASCALLGLTLQGYTGKGAYSFETCVAGPMLMGYMWLSRTWFKGGSFPRFRSNF